MSSITQAPLSGRYLSFVAREEIALLHAQRFGVREIARQIGRSPSTISRELRWNAATRNGGFEYRAIAAQWHADRRGRRQAGEAGHQSGVEGVCEGPGSLGRFNGLVVLRSLARRLIGSVVVTDGTRTGRWGRAWSPEQISNRLRLDFPDDESMRISHKAIYQSLYMQGRGALKRELTVCLRTGRALPVPRARAAARGKGLSAARS